MLKQYLARIYYAGGTYGELWFDSKADAEKWLKREVVRLRGMIPSDPSICGDVVSADVLRNL